MITTTTTLERPPSPEKFSGPGLITLTRIELRKFVDTRSGYWLLLIMTLLSAITMVVQLFWGDEADDRLTVLLELSLIPMAVLLPVLGILTVTTEWSQRTALATFTLVPQRWRILVAKLGASVVVSALSLVVSLLVAAAGTAAAAALDLGDASWSLPGSVLAQTLLLQVLGVVMGVGFGLLLMNTPAAIVLYFLIPTAFTILIATVAAVKDVATWLDLNGAMAPLSSGSMSTGDWQRLATAGLLWIALPLALGIIRLLRREVK
jgi:ABC-2 type transport system permease protein